MKRGRGQTLIEYALLLGMIAIVVIAILTVLGRKARDTLVMVDGSLITTASNYQGLSGVKDPPKPSENPRQDEYNNRLQDLYDARRNFGFGPDNAYNGAYGSLMKQLRGEGYTGDEIGDILREATGNLNWW